MTREKMKGFELLDDDDEDDVEVSCSCSVCSLLLIGSGTSRTSPEFKLIVESRIISSLFLYIYIYIYIYIFIYTI
jgi:hypothetical protein